MLELVAISCEHGGNEIPPPFKRRYIPHRDMLKSHRGWDPGALEVARFLASQFRVPIVESEISRLLVDLNRSIGNPDVFSSVSRHFSEVEKQEILNKYYYPHRDRLFRIINAKATEGKQILHISVHSFTPCLNGKERNADIGILYDPSVSAEKIFSREFALSLKKNLNDFGIAGVVRKNYPYRGKADGVTSWMRKEVPRLYAGIEVEIGQRFYLEKKASIRTKILTILVDSIGVALSG